MQINAVLDKPKFDIAAAAAKLPPDAKRIAAAAGIKLDRRLTVSEVDAALRAIPREMTITQKLSFKVALERAGLLD
jgi:hypothetical protein